MAGHSTSRRGRRVALLLGEVILLAALLFVRSAGQVAGLLIHGSWPHVAIPWFAQAAQLSAPREEPAWAAVAGLLPRQELVASLSVEQSAGLLADHFTREQLGALIGELAERRMAR